MDNIEILDLNGSKYSISDANAIKDSEKGANGGVASLDNNGKIPISQIPSSVIDKDVVVAKTNNETTVSSSSTGNVKTYTVGIDSTLKSNISTSYTHSQTQGNPHNTTIGDINGLRTELTSIESDMDAIEAVIPDEATSSNKLADKAFVNSSITTNTATFRGTSAKNLTEAQFLAWANTLTKTKNDYCFWDTVDSDGNVVFKRYKYDGSNWVYEYSLNNSSFTASQWASINSGIVSGDVSDLHTHLTDNTRHITAAERTTWNGKASQTALDNEIATRTNKDASQDTRIDGIEDDLDDHIADTVKHITSTERTNWNAKATSTDITNAINALDVSDSAVTNQFVTKVSETDGKISVSRAQPTIASVSGLQTALDGKQVTISDLSTIRTSAANGQTAYSWGNHSTAGYLKSADINGKEDKANRVSAWSTTPSDTKYPSEKLVKTALDSKVDKISGKGLSTNDYTTTEKTKLSGIAAGAEVNVQSDWSVTDSASDAFIKNKPTIPAAVTIVQTTGTSSATVMSQKAVTDNLATKLTTATFNTWSGTTFTGTTAKDSDKLDGQHGSYYAAASAIPTKTSQLTNDSNFAVQNGTYTATSGMKVYSAVSANNANNLGGKAASTYLTAHQSLAGYVPTARKVNGKALSADVTIGISDISNLGTYTGYANDWNSNKSKYVQFSVPNDSVAWNSGSAKDNSVAWAGGNASGGSIALAGSTANEASIAWQGGNASSNSVAWHGAKADTASIAWNGGNASSNSVAWGGSNASSYSVAWYGAAASDQSIGVGSNSFATQKSIAFGKESRADGNSLAIGPWYSKAGNWYFMMKPVAHNGSMALFGGSANEGSIAIKGNAIADSGSFVFGMGSNAQDNSVIFGGGETESNIAWNHSFALGFYNVANNYSYALGNHLNVNTDDSYKFAIGKYNVDGNYAFIIGNGTANTNRSNAMVVDWNGNVTATNFYGNLNGTATNANNLGGKAASKYLLVDGSNGTAAGVSNLLNDLSTGAAVPNIADYYISQYAGGGTTTTTYHRRPVSALHQSFRDNVTIINYNTSAAAVTADKNNYFRLTTYGFSVPAGKIIDVTFGIRHTIAKTAYNGPNTHLYLSTDNKTSATSIANKCETNLQFTYPATAVDGPLTTTVFPRLVYRNNTTTDQTLYLYERNITATYTLSSTIAIFLNAHGFVM